MYQNYSKGERNNMCAMLCYMGHVAMGSYVPLLRYECMLLVLAVHKTINFTRISKQILIYLYMYVENVSGQLSRLLYGALGSIYYFI